MDNLTKDVQKLYVSGVHRLFEKRCRFSEFFLNQQDGNCMYRTLNHDSSYNMPK